MACSIILIFCTQISSSDLVNEEPSHSSEIRAEDLKLHIGFLASDELEGRESGKEGSYKAANYIESHFRRIGLKPFVENTFQLEFELERPKLLCRNVVGVLPGTNPKYANDYIAIGGHHDHAGIGGPGAMGFPGEIHNGADDNASGTSGVLELAEYFASNPLEHPIIFMTFSAEERGLLGSKALLDSGVLPNENILFMINLDMIGRMQEDYLFIGGLGTAKELHEQLDPIFEGSKLNLELDDRGEAPSDNTSFFNAGIPALFFFTNIHDDYHMPGDDAHLINYDGEVEILGLVEKVTRQLDKMDSLTFVNYGGMGMPSNFDDKMRNHYRKIMQRSAMKGKLGIRANVTEDGLVLSRVSENSAAEEAGLRTGDLLISVNDLKVTSMELLRRALAGGLKGDKVTMVISRDGTKSIIEAELK
jgi:hypothetical protein